MDITFKGIAGDTTSPRFLLGFSQPWNPGETRTYTDDQATTEGYASAQAMADALSAAYPDAFTFAPTPAPTDTSAKKAGKGS